MILGLSKLTKPSSLVALFDCLGPVEGYDIGIVKINETQLTKNINLNRLRQRKSIIKNYV